MTTNNSSSNSNKIIIMTEDYDDDINKNDDKTEDINVNVENKNKVQNIPNIQKKIQNRIKITSFDDEDGIRDGLSLNTVLLQLKLQQHEETINDKTEFEADTETNTTATAKPIIEIENILIICRLSFTNRLKSNQLIHLIQNGVKRSQNSRQQNGVQKQKGSQGSQRQCQCYYWNKIIFEKNNCKDTQYIACVIQEALKYTNSLMMKQNSKYDGISKWNFSLLCTNDQESTEQEDDDDDVVVVVDEKEERDVPHYDYSQLQELHFSGIRLRGGEQQELFLNSLSNILSSSSSSLSSSSSSQSYKFHNLKVLEFNSCKFYNPLQQYPILFHGIHFNTSLHRLWMVKCSGFQDQQFVQLFQPTSKKSSSKSKSTALMNLNTIQEFGFSYNECGYHGSIAIANYITARLNHNCDNPMIDIFYLNRQQGKSELDLKSMLIAATGTASAYAATSSLSDTDTDTENHHLNSGSGGPGPGGSGSGGSIITQIMQLNISQNYIENVSKLKELQTIVEQYKDIIKVDMNRMTYEVPDTVLPGGNSSDSNGSYGNGNDNGNGNKYHHLKNNNNNTQNNYCNSSQSPSSAAAAATTAVLEQQILSQDEIAKLNIACGRVKYVLGRISKSITITATTASASATMPSTSALNCIVPDLLIILRLQQKQQQQQVNIITIDGNNNNGIGGRKSYRNWIPTFLRKAVKGKNIEILKPLLLLSESELVDDDHDNDVAVAVDQTEDDDLENDNENENDDSSSSIIATTATATATIRERQQLKQLWYEIQELHSNIISSNVGSQQNSHSSSLKKNKKITSGNTKSKKDKKYDKKNKNIIVDDIPMTPEDNPIVRAAYNALPTSIDCIPTSILEEEYENDEGEAYSSTTSFLSLPSPTLPIIISKEIMDDNHEHEHVHDDQHNGKNNKHQHQQQQQQKFCHDDEQQGTDGSSLKKNKKTTSSTKGKKDKKYDKKNKNIIVDGIPMTPDGNPIVRAAYDALPTSIDCIPTSILEVEYENDEGEAYSSTTSFLSLPSPTLPTIVSKGIMDDNHEHEHNDEQGTEGQSQGRRTQKSDIQCCPPIFINTTEALEQLRYNLSQRPPPYHVPKMIAIDSEWYTIKNIPAAAADDDDDVVVAPTMDNNNTVKKNARRNRIKNRKMEIATLQIAYIDENNKVSNNNGDDNDDNNDSDTDDTILIRSFVIDLLSDDQVGYQKTAKAFVSWMIGSSCDLILLGFAFGGDLRQLRKYCACACATTDTDTDTDTDIDADIGGKIPSNNSNITSNAAAAAAATAAETIIAIVESRCLDVQRLLATSIELRTGQLPGLKRCSEKYFQKSLRKDDQCSDWTIRPLRMSQLQYAALDAVILLILVSQKKKTDEEGLVD